MARNLSSVSPDQWTTSDLPCCRTVANLRASLAITRAGYCQELIIAIRARMYRFCTRYRFPTAVSYPDDLPLATAERRLLLALGVREYVSPVVLGFDPIPQPCPPSG